MRAADLAQGAVHTAGVNWESVGAIAAVVAVIMTVVLFIMARRDRRQQAFNTEVQTDITAAVNHLSDVLMAKLETKETVARISERLARVEGSMGIPVRDPGPAAGR